MDLVKEDPSIVIPEGGMSLEEAFPYRATVRALDI